MNSDVIAEITTLDDRDIANFDLNFLMSEIDSNVDMFD